MFTSFFAVVWDSTKREPEILKNIPENTYYDMTSFIEESKAKGLRVGVYPVSQDSWIDIGQWAEYKNAIGKLDL